MKKILMKYGVFSVLLSTVLAAIIAGMIEGKPAALGTLFGGLLSGVSFVGLIYVVSGLVEEQTRTLEKLSMLTILMVKLGVVGFGFWYGLIKLRLSPSGVVAGIGACILGLTLGLNKATSTPEAKEAMARDEARIAAELEMENKRG
jgi:hypothetical protein